MYWLEWLDSGTHNLKMTVLKYQLQHWNVLRFFVCVCVQQMGGGYIDR